jgi:hypothetical protein
MGMGIGMLAINTKVVRLREVSAVEWDVGVEIGSWDFAWVCFVGVWHF